MIRRHIGSDLPHIPVLDVGCGDLSFWHWSDKPLRWRTCHDYTGLDISPYTIYHNQLKKPNWRFLNIDICKQYIPWLKRDVVLCLDVIHHIMNLQDVYWDPSIWLKIIINSGFKNIHTYNNPNGTGALYVLKRRK
jgi:2-polyprenyl-3-methyl-5-hydroxy-6-metoxy-1,4-benzoquinol methylase